MTGIYKIENILNKKMYIGQSKDTKKRIAVHKANLRRGNHANIILQQAWLKYGEDKFKFEIIEVCNIEELNEKEEYYIKKYKTNSKPCGYNIRIDPCSNRGMKWTEEQRRKMEKHFNDENSWYKNHSIHKETMEKAWKANKGRKATLEERQKLSKIRKGKKKKNTINMKLAQQGEKNGYSKLTEEDVKEIKVLLSLKEYTYREIGNVYGVVYSNIGLIKNNRSWKNITYIDDEYISILQNALNKMKGVK